MANRVTTRIEGATATIEFDNPDRRNALSFDLLRDLGTALSGLSSSSHVRVVILTGRGSDFCVGTDLAAPRETKTVRGKSIADDTERFRQINTMLNHFHQMPQVTIAAIDGGCAGAGLSLALAADLRIASERAVFNTAFLTAGLPGDLGGIWFMSRLLGGALARDLYLLPRKLSASEALGLGLVGSVVPAADLQETAQDTARRLASAAPLALRSMKQNLLQSSTTALGDYLAAEAERLVQCARSDDVREAAAAFLEKRPPVFTGR
ncbi:enoyl-CoA hydratase [Rhodococcus sp. WS4]|nr:enoyl-CoA hydratase [Rhodococcus sp. WS4]